MWDLLGPGIEPVSPALAGGFLTATEALLFLLLKTRDWRDLAHGAPGAVRGIWFSYPKALYFDVKREHEPSEHTKTLGSRPQVGPAELGCGVWVPPPSAILSPPE